MPYRVLLTLFVGVVEVFSVFTALGFSSFVALPYFSKNYKICSYHKNIVNLSN